MMIESSSFNGMAVATLVADIYAVKNSFFAKMLLLLTKKYSQQNNILTKNEFLMSHMSATSVATTIPS